MTRRAHRPRPGIARALAFALALLAVLSPVLLGPVVHAALARDMGMSATAMPMDMADCGMDTPPAKPDPHHGPDCLICPLCAALAHPAIAWTPAPVLPAPTVAMAPRPAAPTAVRASPALFTSAAQPRGPPGRA